MRKCLECGQKLCTFGKRISDGWGLESTSLIPVLICTFMPTKLRFSYAILDQNMPSLIEDNQIRQLGSQHQDWVNSCITVYHQRNSLPKAFKHTCGTTDHPERIRVDSTRISAMSDEELVREPGAADRLTGSSAFDVLEFETNASTDAFANETLYNIGNGKFWCTWCLERPDVGNSKFLFDYRTGILQYWPVHDLELSSWFNRYSASHDAECPILSTINSPDPATFSFELTIVQFSLRRIFPMHRFPAFPASSKVSMTAASSFMSTRAVWVPDDRRTT